MALPQSKPEIQEDKSAKDATVAAAPKDLRVEPRYTAALSPARRLQILLEAEMEGHRAPSVKRSMATFLVVSLACSVAVLTLYGLGWM